MAVVVVYAQHPAQVLFLVVQACCLLVALCRACALQGQGGHHQEVCLAGPRRRLSTAVVEVAAVVVEAVVRLRWRSRRMARRRHAARRYTRDRLTHQRTSARRLRILVKAALARRLLGSVDQGALWQALVVIAGGLVSMPCRHQGAQGPLLPLDLGTAAPRHRRPLLEAKAAAAVVAHRTTAHH